MSRIAWYARQFGHFEQGGAFTALIRPVGSYSSRRLISRRGAEARRRKTAHWNEDEMCNFKIWRKRFESLEWILAGELPNGPVGSERSLRIARCYRLICSFCTGNVMEKHSRECLARQTVAAAQLSEQEPDLPAEQVTRSVADGLSQLRNIMFTAGSFCWKSSVCCCKNYSRERKTDSGFHTRNVF